MRPYKNPREGRIVVRRTPRSFKTSQELNHWLLGQNAEIAPANKMPREWQIPLLTIEGEYISSTGTMGILVRYSKQSINVLRFEQPLPQGHPILLELVA